MTIWLDPMRPRGAFSSRQRFERGRQIARRVERWAPSFRRGRRLRCSVVTDNLLVLRTVCGTTRTYLVVDATDQEVENGLRIGSSSRSTRRSTRTLLLLLRRLSVALLLLAVTLLRLLAVALLLLRLAVTCENPTAVSSVRLLRLT